MLQIAAGNAQEKADILAEALGMDLGKPLHVRESNVHIAPYPVPRYFDGAVMETAAVKTPIAAGDVTTRASISVDFELI